MLNVDHIGPKMFSLEANNLFGFVKISQHFQGNVCMYGIHAGSVLKPELSLIGEQC